MRKIILSLLFTGLISVLYAQQYQGNSEDDVHKYCNHAKNLQEQYRQSLTFYPIWYGNYDVKFYFLDINADDDNINVNGNVTMKIETKVDALTVFTFEMNSEMSIDAVEIDGIDKTFTRSGDEVMVEMDAVDAGTMLDVKIFYGGTPPTGGFFSGISNSTHWGFPVTWTLSEPYAAKDWFPCKQDLLDKADSVYIFVTVDNPTVVGSNGLLTAEVELDDNKTRYEWKSNYPIAYYLISIAVSEYQEYNMYAFPEQLVDDSVHIQNFIYDSPSVLNNYKDDMDEAPGILEFLSSKYGLYPFHEEKYGHCLAPMGGGMEHQTMTTQDGFEFGLTAHEMGHQWFGDNVTCATWQDIWVNEGFATYSDYLSEYYIHGESVGNSWMNGCHNTVMSSNGGSTYVPEDELDDIWRIFSSRLTYQKGAAIIHMIRFELQDDELFFNILKTYQEQYAGSVATGEDFKNVVEDVSGEQFDDFFDQWYYGEGYPTYTAEYSNFNGHFYLKTTQSTSTSVTPLFKMLMEYELTFEDGSTQNIFVEQTDNVNEYEYEFDLEVTEITIDPNNWVVNKVSSIYENIEKQNVNIDFAFWPNPANESINVRSLDNSNSSEIVISDVSGKVVYSNVYSTEQINIEVSNFESGLYLIQYKSEGQTITRKLVIK